jgi:hypothetical protein
MKRPQLNEIALQDRLIIEGHDYFPLSSVVPPNGQDFCSASKMWTAFAARDPEDEGVSSESKLGVPSQLLESFRVRAIIAE